MTSAVVMDGLSLSVIVSCTRVRVASAKRNRIQRLEREDIVHHLLLSHSLVTYTSRSPNLRFRPILSCVALTLSLLN